MFTTKCGDLSDGTKKDVNVFLIGLTFFFTFTAFFTMSNIQVIKLLMII